MRTLWLAIGLLFLALGLVGVVLPVLPTTPFLLLAAAAFARSSPRLHGWLLAHPTLGPPIRNWQENGAISLAAKRLAIGTMVVVFGLSLWLALPGKVLIAQGVLMGVGAAFILSRPSGPRGGA
ncbi:MAG: YbaN family protein [Paracoccaceae bacterium]